MIETLPFVAVLISAILHASWNAMARAAPEPGDVVAAAVIAAGIISLPGLAWFGPPGAAAWPWLLGGMVVNTFGIRFAMAAYRHASFGLTYPIMRAGIPLLTLPLGILMLGEWPRPTGFAGVVMIASALIMLAFAAHRAGRSELRGVLFALISAVAGAGYTTADAIGVRLGGNVMGYAFALAIGNAILIGLLTQWERGDLVPMLRRHGAKGLGLSMISMSSFLLYIWAVSITPVALAAALRETSVLFAIAFAHFFLHEAIGRYHLAAAFLAFAGIIAIRIG